MTNFFIANLALADVIIGLFAIPFQVCRDTITDSVVIMITFLIIVMMILTLRCTCLGYHCVPVPSRSASEMEPSLLPLPILPFLSGLYKTLMFRQVFVKIIFCQVIMSSRISFSFFLQIPHLRNIHSLFLNEIFIEPMEKRKHLSTNHFLPQKSQHKEMCKNASN